MILIIAIFAFARQPVIGVTIHPQKYLIDKLIDTEVKVLIGQNMNPEGYSPTLKDIENLKKVDIFFALNNSFEKIILDKLDLKKVIPPSVKLKLIEEDDHGKHEEDHDHEGDTHIWLSIDNNLIMLEQMYHELQKWDDVSGKTLDARYNSIRKELIDLKEDLDEKLKPFKGGQILVYHPAYGYFFNQFEITQIAIEEHGQPSSLKNLENIKILIDQGKLKKFLIRNQNDFKLASKIADNFKIELITVDPVAYDLKNIYLKLGTVFE